MDIEDGETGMNHLHTPVQIIICTTINMNTD